MIQQDNLGPNGDRFYNAIMSAHDGLSPDQSHALNARLVLIMGNQIGDIEVLEDLLVTVRQTNPND